MASVPLEICDGTRYREAVRALLSPRSVAVVGASPVGPGYAAVQNLVASGFAGRIGCVNPRHASVAGIPCVAAVDDLGFVPEAIVLAVGDERVAPLLEQAAEAGVRAAVVFTLGVGGGDGWQERIVATARAAAMAVLGPNCQGAINFAAGVSLYMSPVRAAPAGRVALVSQSGSVLTGLLNNRRGVRFSHAASSGNEAVTDAADLLGAYVDDPAVGVICAYLETIRRPEAFLAQCDRAHDAGKPVIVHKAGRTPRGQAAAVAHTGAMALPERLVAAALRRHRVAVVGSPDELLETAKAMQASVRPRGGAVAAITGSGGHIELLEDEIDAVALTLPAFGEATRRRLRGLLAPFLEPANPIDWWGTPEWERRVPAIVDAAADDPGIDIVVEVDDYAAGFVSNPDRGAESLRRAVAAAEDERVLRVVIDPAGGAPSPEDVDTALAAGVPLLSGMRDGLRALGHLVELSRPPRPHRAPSPAGLAAVRAAGGELQDGINAGAEALAVMAAAGIDVARTIPAVTPAEAVEIAETLGYPVVAKLSDASVAHKTERGGVIVGLSTAADVRAAAARLLAGHGAIVIQAQIAGGIELVAGLRRHELLGSFVVAGIGGVWTEVLDDVAIRSAGLRRGEARAMLDGLRGAPLLYGARGSPPVDIDAAAAALEAIDDIGAALGPDVGELEINPLIVTATRAIAVDALIVKPVAGAGEPDGTNELCTEHSRPTNDTARLGKSEVPVMTTSNAPADTSQGWRGESLQESEEWIVALTDADIEEFERGLHGVGSKDVRAITREDFPLPGFADRLRDVIATVEHGRGFAVIRGLPVYERFSEEESAKIFWAIGRHSGRLVPQDRDGQLLGTLRDLGARGAFQRTYATNEAQGFHQDGGDIVALLCLRQSLYGGDSLVASTLELYREVLEAHPEYAPLLHKNFATDWKSEEPPGSAGWYDGPLFSICDGALSGTVQVARIRDAQRFSEVPRLTGEEVSCMIYIQSVLKRPGMALTMRLQPGDMQFVSNYTVLHARTSFVDSPEDPEYQRALLRLWITPEEAPRPLCDEYAAWREGYAR